MRWWNDLWLNEGFATLMEFIGAGNARPDYHMGQQVNSTDVLASSNVTVNEHSCQMCD